MTHSIISQLPDGFVGDKVTETDSASIPQTVAVNASMAARSSRRAIANEQQSSIWSNIKYGLGMLAFIVIPPLLPGVTTRHLVIMYSGIALAVYLLAFVLALVRTLRKKRRK